MSTITDPHPMTDWRMPLAQLVAAIRRTDDPAFAFEVVQALARLTGTAPSPGVDDPVAVLQAAGWTYLQALMDADITCDRAVLAREAAEFANRLSRVVRGWAEDDLPERLRRGWDVGPVS
ncbi:MAG TPA: hypothetical protein PK313_13040 [Myxococcota bacterium]|mgnify:CR=1 FL=1|nr:hypothetical protein [Myxococcota bacterium]